MKQVQFHFLWFVKKREWLFFGINARHLLHCPPQNPIGMAKVCDISGIKTRSGHRVSHANNKTKRSFYPNLQHVTLYLAEYDLWLPLKIASKTLRTVNKNGLLATLKKAHAKGTLAPWLTPIVA